MRSNLAINVDKTHRNKVAKILEKRVKVRDVMSTRAEAPKRKARQ